jgi:hypothetical protein
MRSGKLVFFLVDAGGNQVGSDYSDFQDVYAASQGGTPAPKSKPKPKPKPKPVPRPSAEEVMPSGFTRAQEQEHAQAMMRDITQFVEKHPGSEALLEGLSEESQQPQLSDWDMAVVQGKLAREPVVPKGWEKILDGGYSTPFEWSWDGGDTGVQLPIQRWLNDVEVTVSVSAAPTGAGPQPVWMVDITPIRGDMVFLKLSPSLSAKEALQRGAQQAEMYASRGAVEE